MSTRLRHHVESRKEYRDKLVAILAIGFAEPLMGVKVGIASRVMITMAIAVPIRVPIAITLYLQSTDAQLEHINQDQRAMAARPIHKPVLLVITRTRRSSVVLPTNAQLVRINQDPRATEVARPIHKPVLPVFPPPVQLDIT